MLRVLLAGALLLAARPALAQPYDPMPILGIAGLDTGQVEVERRAFVARVDEMRALHASQLPAAQEQAYFLIGSAVRQNLFAQQGHRPAFDMADLAQLFEIAAALGIYGAAEVARAMPLRPADAIGAAPPVPDGLRVEFAPPMLRVSSAAGEWSVEVPYYFMIGTLHRFDAPNGMPMEIVTVSTLFARNENREGASQSTILLVFSPTDRVEEFNQFWLDQMRLGTEDRAPTPREGALAYHGYDEPNDMHKEVVLISTPRGPMMAAYVALSGPYAANRVNFIDFLGHLRVP